MVARLFAGHLADLGLRPDPELDVDMTRFDTEYVLPRGLLLLALEPGGAAVGMAGVRGDEIRRVFVERPWRGRRLATRLVSRLLQRVPPPSSGRFRAVLARDNLPSRRLFLSLGFRPAGLGEADVPARCEVYELDEATLESRQARQRISCLTC